MGEQFEELSTYTVTDGITYRIKVSTLLIREGVKKNNDEGKYISQ